MVRGTLRLRHSDVLRTLDTIDLLDISGRELRRRLVGAPDRPGIGRFVPDLAEPGTPELTAVRDLETAQVCLMPTPSLQMINLAALATLAARELIPPGDISAAVFGSGATAQLYLEVIARYLPNISHLVLVQPSGAASGPPVERSVRDRLEEAEIELSVVTSSGAAAAGTNLLVIAEVGRDRPNIGRLKPGALVVNATRRDLPDEVLAEVDKVYVDDMGLLEHNQHRKVARLHLAETDVPPEPVRQPLEGWHRLPSRWRREQRVETDLAHLLSGLHEPANVDDILLVELLGGTVLDANLGCHIHRAAVASGLGLWAHEEEKD